MYSTVRQLLFSLPPELAHALALGSLDWLSGWNRLRHAAPEGLETEVFGLRFPSPVGLAAGLDKNAEHIDGLAAVGFSFIEVGTVTPKPQPGNLKPRLFRLPEAEAIINRMGFNNQGVDYLLNRVGHSRYSGILGINIGKNAKTPVEKAEQDYLRAMERVYETADYITVNISSPNTPGLRDLQHGDSLQRLLDAVKQQQYHLHEERGHYVPLLVKVAPDLNEDDIADMSRRFLDTGIDGVIATNTTFSRQGVEGLQHHEETGGLSGAPLTQAATDVVAAFYAHLGERLPLVAAGGTMTAEDALAKLDAGAKLVQLYTGFIYHGPDLIRDIHQALLQRQKETAQ